MDRTQAVEESEELDGTREVRPARGAPGGTKVTFALLVLAVPFLAWSALPIVGLDTNRYTAALVALTQYAVPTGALITLLGLVLRRWLTTVVVGAVTVVLVFSVAPRAIPDQPTPTQGTPVRVLSANVYFSETDAGRIVDLVRRNEVDVLSLQELTPEFVTALDRAGLPALLPNRAFDATSGGAGTGIASRFPLRRLDLVPATTMRQPSVSLDLPGARDIEFVAAHPTIPVGPATGDWIREIGVLPAPANEPGDPPRVVAGDFNATLDHTPLRAQLGRGYADAAEVAGDGLQPTWPARGGLFPPPVTIDHVLVSGGIVVQGYRTFDVEGSDHRAILAHLAVPR